MKTNMFRICAMLAIGVAASLQTLHAQQNTLEGVWNVRVTVTDCNTGELIRTVQSLQAFRHDGTMVEAANTASRGISEGVYNPDGARVYAARYWFFRYTSTGAFASIATITDSIQLGSDGHFTSKGMVVDHDANGNLISTGCFIHTAFQLADSER